MNKLQRWATVLSANDFVVQCKRTDSFGHDDALSRPIVLNAQIQPEVDVMIPPIIVGAKVSQPFQVSLRNLQITFSSITNAAQKDPAMQNAKFYSAKDCSAVPNNPKITQF